MNAELPETPQEKKQPFVARLDLRDGRTFVVGGMSSSQLKFLRRNGGMITLKNNVDGSDVAFDGKLIKTITPLKSSPQSV